MKPTPVSAIDCATACGDSMMLAPSASSTSALPDFDDTERPPCLATRAPAPAATNIDAVEMLNVCCASPPVPTMSSRCSRSGTSTLVANSRITCAAAAISPTVSFLTRRPTVSAAIITGVTSPLMIWRITDSISSWKISRCSIVRWSASCSVIVIVAVLSMPASGNWRAAPCRARSGSPRDGTARLRPRASRWRTPMISPSSDVAVTSSSAGQLARLDRQRMVARGGEWRRQTFEHASPIVRDRRHLAVHHLLRAHDRCRRTPGRSTGDRGTRRGSESCRRSGGSAAPRCRPRAACTGPAT